jgi:hypothetical protein
MRRRIVRVKQPVLVPPSPRKFSADLLPQTLRNLQVVMLVHSLAWRNKFLVNTGLVFRLDVPRFLQTWRGRALPLRGLLFCFRVVTVKSGFVSCYKSRDSSVGIAVGYELDDRGSRVRFPAGAGNFSLHHRAQNGSGAHPASYLMGNRVSFPGGKAAGA